MKKHINVQAGQKGNRHPEITALCLVSFAFLLGGILGAWAEHHMDPEAYIQAFCQAMRQGWIDPTVIGEFWGVFRWPIMLLILKFLPMAGFLIPLTFCLRGFLLSYSISAFMAEGIQDAIFLFGPTCLLTIPVIFLMGVDGLLRKAGTETQKRPGAMMSCFLALCLCVVLNLTVVPALLGSTD